MIGRACRGLRGSGYRGRHHRERLRLHDFRDTDAGDAAGEGVDRSRRGPGLVTGGDFAASTRVPTSTARSCSTASSTRRAGTCLVADIARTITLLPGHVVAPRPTPGGPTWWRSTDGAGEELHRVGPVRHSCGPRVPSRRPARRSSTARRLGVPRMGLRPGAEARAEPRLSGRTIDPCPAASRLVAPRARCSGRARHPGARRRLRARLRRDGGGVDITARPTPIRNHMEQQVRPRATCPGGVHRAVRPWVWGDQQTRHLAAEAGVTKGTLTGVLKTLEKRPGPPPAATTPTAGGAGVPGAQGPARYRSGCSPRSTGARPRPQRWPYRSREDHGVPAADDHPDASRRR